METSEKTQVAISLIAMALGICGLIIGFFLASDSLVHKEFIADSVEKALVIMAISGVVVVVAAFVLLEYILKKIKNLEKGVEELYGKRKD